MLFSVISDKEKVSIFKALSSKSKCLRLLNVREQTKRLMEETGIPLEARVEDPEVASWLLSTSGHEDSLRAIVGHVLPLALPVADLVSAGNSNELTDIQACWQSVLVFHTMSLLRSKLEEWSLWDVSIEQFSYNV